MVHATICINSVQPSVLQFCAIYHFVCDYFHLLTISVGYEARGLYLPNNYIHPIILYGILIIWYLLPVKFLFGRIRYWMIHALIRGLCSPFTKVHFRDFWFADQLTSLGDILFELQFIGCIYPIQQEPGRMLIIRKLLT
jgi:hypothetical protein